uniref:50S ribosomal protein L21, mitochondrial n=1 Tax=Aegilops tauschii subsp. strangulata TaxID=200361 RepID=A0A453NSR0_AEGTS
MPRFRSLLRCSWLLLARGRTPTSSPLSWWIGSRQYIVMPGRYIYTQRLKDANVNDQIILNKVLLVSTRDKAYIGMPVVTNAAVHAIVEEQGLDDKVIVFKFKKKKKYQRKAGHRQVSMSSLCPIEGGNILA